MRRRRAATAPRGSPGPPPLAALLLLGGPAIATVARAAECFADREELKYAVDVCFEGGVGDRKCHTRTVTDEAECARAKERYGWPMNSWCVGNVDDLHFLFVEKRDFNEDINGWDTSAVTDLYETFSYAESLDQDLSGWDVSRVTKMFGLFNGCASFNGDISTWDTSSLEDMQWMFYNMNSFNGDISQWDVSRVTNMYEAFCFASSFNGELNEWDTSSVEYMGGLFWGATSFNQDISSWDVSKADTMWGVFYRAESFNQDVSRWDISSAAAADGMFWGATSFNQDLCAWGDAFPYGGATDGNDDYYYGQPTFGESGCAFQDTPESKEGPFCASDCLAPEEATSGSIDEGTSEVEGGGVNWSNGLATMEPGDQFEAEDEENPNGAGEALPPEETNGIGPASENPVEGEEGVNGSSGLATMELGDQFEVEDEDNPNGAGEALPSEETDGIELGGENLEPVGQEVEEDDEGNAVGDAPTPEVAGEGKATDKDPDPFGPNELEAYSGKTAARPSQVSDPDPYGPNELEAYNGETAARQSQVSIFVVGFLLSLAL